MMFPGAYPYIVLQANTTSTPTDYSSLYYACMGDSNEDGTRDITLSDLSLQMNIVIPLKELSTEASIPYLEWQLTIDSSEPFADNKSMIIGEGYHQGTRHIFYSSDVITRSTTGENTTIYTLSN